jgi:uncharacterized protein YukE
MAFDPATNDYDHSTLNIDPPAMVKSAEQMNTIVGRVADTLKSMGDTVFGLKLGWAGQSSQEAEQFLNQWNSTMHKMFGTQDDPESGVLTAMAGGVQAAERGYSATELDIARSFMNFMAAMQQPGSSGTPTSSPASITDPNASSVSETFG